ncbi:MAG: hypothetical protein QOI75_6841, partial [Pseudonocardiales bacterium]|nr:hypothetical protein [Pseudonocardiales bacterium]
MSTRRLDKRDFVLVTIEADDTDHAGLGYAYAGTTGGRLLAQAVHELLEPVAMGADARDITGL